MECGESAGNFGENGALSPVAGWGTGSTGLSRRTRHFHLRGKCREFLRKRFTFPRGRQGHWLYRPLSPHLAFPLQGKVPGISAKTVHFPPCGVLMKIQQSKRPGPPTASRRAPPSRAEGGEWSAGKVPGIPARMVHFPLRRCTFPWGGSFSPGGGVFWGGQQGVLGEVLSIQVL